MTASKLSTTIQVHGDVARRPSEVYGTGQLLFRLGSVLILKNDRDRSKELRGSPIDRNGGAGATGLLKVLCETYLQSQRKRGRIEWICNHSRNTQIALHRGYIDIALTYEREYEALAQAEGWSVTIGPAFHDHFCFAGPYDDPANIRQCKSVSEALAKIAKAECEMHSRVDGSATMAKERQLWKSTGLAPWEDRGATSTWYKTSQLGPAEALTAADKAGAYLLTDRSTLLAQTGKRTISDTTCFFEPTSTKDNLMNSCYILRSSQRTQSSSECDHFIEWLQGHSAQAVVDSYGTDLVGFPLFASKEAGIARQLLTGGRPEGGRWLQQRKNGRL